MDPSWAIIPKFWGPVRLDLRTNWQPPAFGVPQKNVSWTSNICFGRESAHSVIFWIATLQTFQQQIRLGGGFSNLASAATRRFKSEVESCLAASARQPPLSEEAQRRAGPVAAPLYLWFISLKPPLPSGKLTQLWKIIIFNG